MVTKLQLLIIPLVFSLHSACASRGGYPSSESGVPSGVDIVIQPRDEIEERPSAYVDKNVLIRGKIVELPATNAFRLEYDKGIMGMGDDSILVIQPQGSTAVLSEGGKVEVMGKVKLLNISQAERELNMQLNREAFEDYQDKPVIIAQSVLNR